jgi:hypothetical protein
MPVAAGQAIPQQSPISHWKAICNPAQCFAARNHASIKALAGLNGNQEQMMYGKRIAALAIVGLLGSTGIVFAQNSSSEQTPGHMMQQKGSKNGEPGASGYTPGHRMQEKGSKKGSPGASGYAPGHTGTTGENTREGTRTRTRH